MTSAIVETTVTWMLVEHPAASPQVRGARLLPSLSRFRGGLCPQSGDAGPAGAPGRSDAPGRSELLGDGLSGGEKAGRMGLSLRNAVGSAHGTDLPLYRTAGAGSAAEFAPIAEFAPTAEFAPIVTRQGAFLAGIDVPTVPMTAVLTTPVPTTPVPTTPVRNEKQHYPGPPVPRPPL